MTDGQTDKRTGSLSPVPCSTCSHAVKIHNTAMSVYKQKLCGNNSYGNHAASRRNVKVHIECRILKHCYHHHFIYTLTTPLENPLTQTTWCIIMIVTYDSYGYCILLALKYKTSVCVVDGLITLDHLKTKRNYSFH